jgi:hypothetical protein
MAEYPQSDYPWTLYFNGCEMPRYANCWGECEASALFYQSCIQEWPNPKDTRAAMEKALFDEIYFTIDHVGSIESANPLEFRRISLRLLYALLSNRERILEDLTTKFPNLGSPQAIFQGVSDGLFSMDKLAAEQNLAFWSAGYNADQENLVEVIQRSKLPPTDPDYFEPPHLVRRRADNTHTIEFLRKDILKLLGTLPLNKEIRHQIHEIPE